MKIAAHVNDNGEVASLYEKGHIRIYEGTSRNWTLTKEFPFDVGTGKTIADAREALGRAVERFDDCRVLLSGDVRGFLYSVLQEKMDFRTWKSDGPLVDQLAMVERREQELAAQACGSAGSCGTTAERSGGCGSGGCGPRREAPSAPGVSAPPPKAAEHLGNGYYRFDLAAALKGNAALNSRQLLIPLLSGTAFRTLEIFCDHLPRWFDAKLAELNLDVDIETVTGPGRGLRAIVTRRKPADRQGGTA